MAHFAPHVLRDENDTLTHRGLRLLIYSDTSKIRIKLFHRCIAPSVCHNI